jgi:predicted nucleotidyltransferase
MANPNLNLLIAMAQAMGPLCEQVVFVGGCATGLLVDDVGLMDVRPTEDVDAIVEVASLAAYHRLADQLMQRGFKQTMADNTPPFRWFWNRMQLDLVPLDEKVLGFANAWYRAGFEAALSVELADGLQLRHLSAPHFLATKFEAFKDRGQNDVYLSHDLEDIMTVMAKFQRRKARWAVPGPGQAAPRDRGVLKGDAYEGLLAGQYFAWWIVSASLFGNQVRSIQRPWPK